MQLQGVLGDDLQRCDWDCRGCREGQLVGERRAVSLLVGNALLQGYNELRSGDFGGHGFICSMAINRVKVSERLNESRLVSSVQDVPKVLKGKAFPALLATGRGMGIYGATFAAIGAAFSAVDVRVTRAELPMLLGYAARARQLTHVTHLRAQCMAETARGRKDMWNGVLGGAAAGAVLGMRGEQPRWSVCTTPSHRRETLTACLGIALAPSHLFGEVQRGRASADPLRELTAGGVRVCTCDGREHRKLTCAAPVLFLDCSWERSYRRGGGRGLRCHERFRGYL